LAIAARSACVMRGMAVATLDRSVESKKIVRWPTMSLASAVPSSTIRTTGSLKLSRIASS
jgi:hypothetical protein